MKAKLIRVALCSSILLMTACGDDNIAKVKNYPLNNLFTYGQSIDSADYCKKVRWSSEQDDYGRWKVTAKCPFVISPWILEEDIEKIKHRAQTEEQFDYEKLNSNISVYESAIDFYSGYLTEKESLESALSPLDPYAEEAEDIKEKLRALNSMERNAHYSLRDFFNHGYLDVESSEDITALTRKLDNLLSSREVIENFIAQEKKTYIKSLDRFKKDISGEKEHTFLITNSGDVKLESTRLVINQKEIPISWDFGAVVMMDLHRPKSGYFLREASRLILPRKFSISVSCEDSGECTSRPD